MGTSPDQHARELDVETNSIEMILRSASMPSSRRLCTLDSTLHS